MRGGEMRGRGDEGRGGERKGEVGRDGRWMNRTEQNRYVYLESYTKIVHRLFPNK